MTRHDEKRHDRDLRDAMEYCMAHEGEHYGAGDVRSTRLVPRALPGAIRE